MFGFGFLNSLFLSGLAAMALPIIIHILNRRRLRKVKFSSLQFLNELSRRRMSKVNLRRWIILLLRTLAVVLLVFAFARPTIHSGAAFFMPGEAPTYVVLCVDVSASMGVERETGTAFDVAKDLATQIVDEAGSNDIVNIVTFAAHSDATFETGTKNKQIVRRTIADLQLTAEGTAERPAVEKAIELIDASEIGTGVVYVISDFREAGDSTLTVDSSDHYRVVYVPVYEPAVDNVSIDRVFTPRKLIRPGEVVRIGVTVTNHSRENPANFPLELLVEDKRKAEQFVKLAPSSSSTIAFAVSINDWGRYHCRVAKNRDRLPIDDDRMFLLEVSQKIPVTLLRGRKFAGDDKETASFFFVEKALNPRGSGEGEFKVDVIDESDVTISRLGDNTVVVWTDPDRVDRQRFDLIKRFVHAGGSLMVFFGDDRGALRGNNDITEYLGLQKTTVKENAEGESWTSFAKDHPVFSLFNEEELELLSRSRFRRFVAATGVAPDSVLAYFTNSDPAIWETRRGKGRILVVACSPDMLSGDLPLSPMFLPFVHTSMSYLASGEASDFRREDLAGHDLFFDLPARWAGSSMSLYVTTDDGEQTKPAFYETPQGDSRVVVARPRRVGFYRLLSDTTLIAETAVNLDTKESNLNPRVLAADRIGDARIIATGAGFIDNLRREKEGREVYALFFLLAASTLALEAVLGRKA